LANPAIEKFGNKYYMYYGEFINGKYEVFVAIGEKIE
jgi:hypothetical protein